MSNNITRSWLEFSMGVAVPVIGINKIMIATAERLVNKQIDMALDQLDFWRQHMKILAEMKDNPASLADEGKLLAGYGNKIIERTDEFLKIASDTKQSLIEIAADKAVDAQNAIRQESGVTAKAA